MLASICSAFLSKLLPIRFLFCPHKLISSVWLIAIIFCLSLTMSNVYFFHGFVKHCSIIHFGGERLGVWSPKLRVVGRTDFTGSGSCATVCLFVLHVTSWKVWSLLVADSHLSFWKQVCCLEWVIMGNSLFEGFNLTGLRIEANFLSLLPPWLLQEEKCFAFSLGNKKGVTFFMEWVITFRDRAEGQSSPAGLENANIDAMRRI